VQTLEKEWSVVEEESLKNPTPGTFGFFLLIFPHVHPFTDSMLVFLILILL
jgi:hypothetical protein